MPFIYLSKDSECEKKSNFVILLLLLNLLLTLTSFTCYEFTTAHYEYSTGSSITCTHHSIRLLCSNLVSQMISYLLCEENPRSAHPLRRVFLLYTAQSEKKPLNEILHATGRYTQKKKVKVKFISDKVFQIFEHTFVFLSLMISTRGAMHKVLTEHKAHSTRSASTI